MENSEIENFFESYIKKIGVSHYSLFFIDMLSNTDIHSNMPNSWINDFIFLKMDINSDIIIKSHNRLSPFVWELKDISNIELKDLALSYGITMGATFIVKINTITILFNIYANHNKERFLDIFNYYKDKIQLDLLIFCENNIYAEREYIILTIREREVFNLLKIGKTYDEIAFILKIKERTVRFHTHNIIAKLNVSSIKHAIFKATKIGLI